MLRRPCPECGFDTSSFAREDIPAMILANAAAWPAPARRPGAVRRPRPDKWSALEYGCHVRDVLRLYDYRLGLMLTEDDPLYPNWDQDETAIADRYDAQDPATVAAELAAAAETLASRFAAVPATSGRARAAAATAPRSRWRRSPGTSCTTRCTTCTTSRARTRRFRRSQHACHAPRAARLALRPRSYRGRPPIAGRRQTGRR